MESSGDSRQKEIHGKKRVRLDEDASNEKLKHHKNDSDPDRIGCDTLKRKFPIF